MGNCLGLDLASMPLLQQSSPTMTPSPQNRGSGSKITETPTMMAEERQNHEFIESSLSPAEEFKRKHSALSHSPFKFCILDEHMLTVFAGLCTFQIIQPQKMFFSVGKAHLKSLYVVGAGKAELFDEFGRPLVIKQRGDWFGRGALFFGRKNDSSSAPLSLKERKSSLFDEETSYGVRNSSADEVLEVVKIDSKALASFLDILEFEDGMIPEIVADVEKKLIDIFGLQSEIILNEIPLFQMNSNDGEKKLPLLAAMFRHVVLMEHELLFEEDQVGESLYILVSGTLKLKTRESKSEKRRAVYVDLEPGSCLGELCLLGAMRRTATVVAKERCLLLELGKEEFSKLRELTPQIADRIMVVLKEIMCVQFQRYDIPFFRAIPKEKFSLMGSLVDIEYRKTGEVIFNRGDVADFLYIVTHGSVSIYYDTEEKAMELSKIGAGNYFGEVALITDNERRSASAKAASNCILVKMSRKDCDLFFSQVPEALERFKERLIKYQIQVDTVLSHPQGLNYFYLHCQKEFNTENVNFWSAIQNFEQFAKTNPSSQELRVVAEQMYQEFVAPGARHGCNLVVSTVNRISKPIEDPNTEVTGTLFSVAKEDLLVLIRDPFTRFKSTKQFHKFLKELDAYEPVLEVKL